MRRVLLLSVICAALVACGGGNVKIDNGNVNVVVSTTVPTLSSLRVTGSGAASSASAVSIASGDFTVEWDAVAVDASTLNLYLSADAVKDTSDLDLFLTANPQKNSRAQLSWKASQVQISLAGIPQDVSTFFAASPSGKGYIIARACGIVIDTANGERKECQQKEVGVVLLK
ncbi:hypothetical protein HQ393_09765 [Chitinibacter bivalviorum]|uniref:Lipoprotein n=1 Tax=Chitinibacter bivalviorum TaxID=2739434 RepID=A0A7H9BKG8_9NEIS|nr:hypothetical protein [Chitinibacter bivalviorum]QLG88511.1 hypothetical protein HQ393_09765 [Chitinibacter bivalviorum]